ncbi:tRNA (adenosine(37)-N6)-threonylcarbamoyltransferase complex dimerization subunit type 1 TsaB [Salisaeta longa]|uniref:tRNA (adenosine(37)-N6)-threonylcarbamoyltransferase complex dimerization subunit type 1 TsaB n=1 Tax=Salisaeta longa TaxID=503170 RepID=UPI0003B65B46|nr:tRNA (adenosine(37)-N6)-threonylcarbamoyltransferase complex dimerization subunit type 1 TsaB [Salisaeta longa]
MTILALETATATCGVALWHEGRVQAEAHVHQPRVHAQRLTPLVEAVLEQAGCARRAVDVVAVSEGPGSYTGLRIGVSTALGWAEALDVPVLGVSTLEALAASATPYVPPGARLVGALDARRDDVYAAAYAWDGTALTLQREPTACAAAAVAEWIDEASPTWMIGPGAAKCAAASAHGVTEVLPAASWVARRAAHHLGAGATPVARTAFEPFYLKAFHGTPAPSPLARLDS